MISGIPSPSNMSALDWTDQLSSALAQYGPFRKLEDPEQWKSWGASLLAPVALGGYVLADPYQFVEWREWADSVFRELS